VEFPAKTIRGKIGPVSLSIALAGALLLTGCGGGGGSSSSGSGGGSGYGSGSGSGSGSGGGGGTTNTTPPLSTATVLAEMAPGINLGNTLEAVNQNGQPFSTSQETYWGNPVVNQAIFDGYKAAGFKSVRIPVAWTEYADAQGNIAPFWMTRVKQVVDMARKSGLYVIINIHWDGGWIQAKTSVQDAVNAKLNNFWTQIATAFQGYDDHVLFAGTNEIGVDGEFGAPTASECTVQNSYNQTFVKAVRATGGNNATRPLVVQAYQTNIDASVSCNSTLPTDTVAGRLIMEVHYYDPYDFTINGNSNIWQWGSIATDASATETWANEVYTDGQFQKMKTSFIDKGVPVIMGEYGAYDKPAYPGMDKYRIYWIKYVTHSAYSHGVVPMYWDTGDFFDRNTGAQKDPTAISTLIDAAK
jgi:endoglucanase